MIYMCNGFSCGWSYRAAKYKSVVGLISSFFSRDTKEEKANEAEYDNEYAAKLGNQLSVFSKSLLNAPWDATIKR